MKSKPIEKIPFGSSCYTVVEMKPNEFEGVDLHEYGKGLREHPYHGLSKAVLCPYWRRTDYGMTICEFTGDQSLDEYEAGSKEKAIDHFGSEARLRAHWTSIVLHDQAECCGIREDDPGVETHLAPAFIESLLAVLLEGSEADELYRARVRRFLVSFLDIPGKPTDDEIGRYVRGYVDEWSGG